MGIAIRPDGRALMGTRSRAPQQRKTGNRKDERVSVTVVLFFTIASTAISVYDLVLFFKLLVM